MNHHDGSDDVDGGGGDDGGGGGDGDGDGGSFARPACLTMIDADAAAASPPKASPESLCKSTCLPFVLRALSSIVNPPSLLEPR